MCLQAFGVNLIPTSSEALTPALSLQIFSMISPQPSVRENWPLDCLVQHRVRCKSNCLLHEFVSCRTTGYFEANDMRICNKYPRRLILITRTRTARSFSPVHHLRKALRDLSGRCLEIRATHVCAPILFENYGSCCWGRVSYRSRGQNLSEIAHEMMTNSPKTRRTTRRTTGHDGEGGGQRAEGLQPGPDLLAVDRRIIRRLSQSLVSSSMQGAAPRRRCRLRPHDANGKGRL